MSFLENAVRRIVREEILASADTEDSAAMQILAKLDALTSTVNGLSSNMQEVMAQVTGINDRLAHVEEYLSTHGYTPLGD